MARMHWYEIRTAGDPEAYVERLSRSLRLYPGNVTATLVAVIGETKTYRKRFTIRLERDVA